MANDKQNSVPASPQRKALKFELAYKQRKAAEEARRTDQTTTLRAHQPLARIAFLALVGMLLYLSTVAYNTTHLDLLLNTKVGVIWSLVELPRRWVLGVGSLVLSVLLYEAISLHHRVDRQFQAWRAALPENKTKQNRHLLWLHGGLITDHYSAPAFGRLLPVLSQLVLYGVLWLAPVLTLTFVQAVVMPVHSEWLSGAVRVSLIIVVLLVMYSAVQRRAKGNAPQRKWQTIRLDWCVAGAICMFGTYLSLHVFLWPSESLQRLQAAIAPSAMVWDPAVNDRSTYRHFFGLHCGSDPENPWSHSVDSTGEYSFGYTGYSYDNYHGNVDYGGWKRKGFNTSKPQSTRADFGNNTSYFIRQSSIWDCPDRDDKTVVSTQLLRAWISHQSKRFSPNYDLTDQIVNGRNLKADERDHLSKHTADQPLHPKFFETLEQLLPLDLSSENLRFATFCHAWLPNVKLPPPEKLEGANFCGAKLQGVQLASWRERPVARESAPFSRLHGIDLSGGALFAGQFEDLTLGFTAISARIDGLQLKGVAVMNADWRFASLVNPLFLQSESMRKDVKNSISHSKFDGASMVTPQFHATEIWQSSFVGTELSNPLFFQGTKVSGSDFSLANLAGPAETYEGKELVTWNDSKLNLTQLRVRDRSKHVFDKSVDGSSGGRTLIIGTLEVSQRNNPIGPLWIADTLASSDESASLNKASANYWLVQQQRRASDSKSGRTALDETYYQNVLRRCESSDSSTQCYGFSPTLQSLARGTMRELCEKYAAYVSDDVANTLYTAATVSNPKERLGESGLDGDAQRKKFTACLKDKLGQPRSAGG